MGKTTNFAKEFKLYESLFSNKKQDNSLKENYEVWVEGESRIMPNIFYKTTQAVNGIIQSIEEADIDSYDDHYFNGSKMQWNSKWNIFEPITFDVDDLEKQLKDLVASKNDSKYEMSIDFDRDMLEDDGCLNINLSLETDLIENLQEEPGEKKETRTADDIQAEIERLQQELQQVKVAEKSATYTKFPTELWAWDMYMDESKKGTWCSIEKDDFTWDGRVFETEDDAIRDAQILLGELDGENELPGDPDEYTIDTFSIPITELTVEILEDSDLEHLIPAIIE